MSLSACLLAEGTNKEKMETRKEQKVCSCSGINHQPQFSCSLGVCVSENRLCTCIVTHFHYLYFVFPCSHVFSASTLSFKCSKRCKGRKFKEKTISQSEWHESMSNRVVTPHSCPHPLFVCLFCCLVVVVVLLKF